MRLLDVKAVLDMEKGIQGVGPHTQVFRELDDKSEKYAILSHRWGEELNYDEMTRFMEMGEHYKNEVRQRAGYEKIIKSCKLALQDGYRWIWIDTCCIDKRSSSELSEAINSMYRWYRKSQKCYVYLNDVGGAFFPNERDLSKFAKANGWPEWFSRGWTLQELIAPKQVEFFNKDWVFIGSKQNLADTLEKITRIPIDVLKDGRIPRRVCVAGIMSWAADRNTMRVEDRAYSLLGLFGVNMPILYGEGAKAFHRLQLEIIRASGDQSIFAWNPKGQFGWVGSVLAGDPGYFRGCHDIEKVESDKLVDELMKYTRRNRFGIARMPDFGSNLACLRSRGRAFRQQLSVFLVTNVGIQVRLPVIPHRDSESVFRAILACRDYYGNLITIDLKSLELSSYRIAAARRFRHSRSELRTLYLASSVPDFEEYHHFKVDDTHALYHGFTRRGVFPDDFTGDTFTFSSLTSDFVVIVYANDDTSSRFAVGLGHYLGRPLVYIACEKPANGEVPWTDFCKKVYDALWVAPVEQRSDSGVKCAHLPQSIWDARVVWYTGNVRTNVMVDVGQCPGCCIGPRECTTASDDRDGLNMPGFMKTVHNIRGLKLDGKNIWLYECSDQRIALGDYGDYSNGNFKPDGNIFENMRTLGIDPADPAYRSVVSYVSGGANVSDREQGQHGSAVEFRLQGEYLTLHSPNGLSLPNNQQLVLLLKALSTRLAGRHLVTTIIQCSDLHTGNGEKRREDSEGDSASKSDDRPIEPSLVVPLCTVASPHVWRREPPCAQRRELFKSIRKHFYILANLHRPPGAEAGRESASRWITRGAVKFLSDIFGLEHLKNCVGEITFFKELRSVTETRSRYSSTFIRNTNIASSRSLSARPATSLWTSFKSRAAQNPRVEIVAPPLLEKCKAFGPLVNFRRYLVAKQQARCQVKSMSQTLGVGLLEHIYTAILYALEDETHGIGDAGCARRVDIHITLLEIKALQTKLDATDDEDEQRALEEDVTGMILWFSWCGILSEVEQLLAEVVNYIRRERDSKTPDGGDRFRQGLREIADIIKKTTQYDDHDDDLGHLKRIMFDASTGVSKQRLWLAARAAEKAKWSSIPTALRTCDQSKQPEMTCSD